MKFGGYSCSRMREGSIRDDRPNTFTLRADKITLVNNILDLEIPLATIGKIETLIINGVEFKRVVD